MPTPILSDACCSPSLAATILMVLNKIKENAIENEEGLLFFCIEFDIIVTFECMTAND